MTMTISSAQGRAPCLYDEQLQRQQQEKRLFAGFGSAQGRLGLRREPKPAAPEVGGGQS
jgi:hypothetical protein